MSDVRSESFSVGDLIEVISASHKAPVRVGDRGTVVDSTRWDTHVEVDYGHFEHVLSRRDCIRKVRPPQDWGSLCHLDEVKHEEPAHV